jgi:hypothetical protein
MAKDKIEILETEQEHIDYLIDHLRLVDIEEIKDMWGVDDDRIVEVVQTSFLISKKCWTLLKNNEVVCCWGVTTNTFDDRNGIVWLLGTYEMANIKMKFVRESKKYIQKMMENYELLENYVSVKNELSIKWLKWCGFKLEEPVPIGVNDNLFRRFYMEDELCVLPQ